MKCSECKTNHDEGELVIKKQGGRLIPNGITAHECPECGNIISEEYTRWKNVDNCTHSVTKDTEGEEFSKECSLCGARFNEEEKIVDINIKCNAAGKE